MPTATRIAIWINCDLPKSLDAVAVIDVGNMTCLGVLIPLRYKPVVVQHDDVIKWKYFPHYWPFMRVIHRSPVDSPHKGQWRRALMFSMICAWSNGWTNNGDTGDLRGHCAHYDITVMILARCGSHRRRKYNMFRRNNGDTITLHVRCDLGWPVWLPKSRWVRHLSTKTVHNRYFVLLTRT